jgi:peptide/nickel transport system substrate-binding protein
MKLNRRSVLHATTGIVGLATLPRVAFGQGRAETLRYVTGANVNTLDVEIQKKPDAEFNTMESDKTLGFFIDAGTAWLPATYYYFFYLYFTRDQRWNFASWKNADIEQLSAEARFERDPAKYEEECRKMIGVFAENVPLIMLWQPNHDAVMAKNIDGYTYQFYRQADFRDLKRV